MIWRAPTLLLIGLAAGAVGYWSTDRDPPVTTQEVKLVTPVVSPGGTLKYEVRVDRHRSCAANIDRFLTDADKVRYVLDDLTFAAAPGPLGEDVYKQEVPIPKQFALGRGCYRNITRYECNIIHKLAPIVLQGEPLCFDVVPESAIGPESIKPP